MDEAKVEALVRLMTEGRGSDPGEMTVEEFSEALNRLDGETFVRVMDDHLLPHYRELTMQMAQAQGEAERARRWRWDDRLKCYRPLTP
jgi:hypothetical protein